MTTWYVSSAATGTGTGTQASPWDMTQAFAGAATGDTVYAINDGTYSEAAQLAPTNNNWLLQGYQTTPGDSGVITMEASVSLSYLIYSVNNNGWQISQVKVDNTNQNITTSPIFIAGSVTNAKMSDITVINPTNPANGGSIAATGSVVERAFLENTEILQVSSGTVVRASAIILNNTSATNAAYGINGGCDTSNTIVVIDSGSSSSRALDTPCSSYGVTFDNCVFHSTSLVSGQDAIILRGNNTPNPGVMVFRNCVFSNWSTIAANVTGSGPYPNLIFENCAYFNCTSLGIGTWINPVALTADPFVNPTATINSLADAQAAFSLNNTAGGGALCRGAGTPQYLDIGATQHQDSGGGGVPRIVVPRRMW